MHPIYINYSLFAIECLPGRLERADAAEVKALCCYYTTLTSHLSYLLLRSVWLMRASPSHLWCFVSNSVELGDPFLLAYHADGFRWCGHGPPRQVIAPLRWLNIRKQLFCAMWCKCAPLEATSTTSCFLDSPLKTIFEIKLWKEVSVGTLTL